MKNLSCRILLFLAFLAMQPACEPEKIIDPHVDDTHVAIGILQVEFQIKHIWIPSDRIVRVGLHVAESAQLLFRGDFLQSANVTDNKQYYTFNLAPGTYYYEAIIACLCGGDSCSAGGFQGNQFAQKHTMGKFEIVEDETTLVKPTFQ
ncbi:MAG: hypothetical protein J7L96_01975 [Bacteroidales bacterium]|nr:hypothetical protein [Bacteroidales bacterium]